MAGEKEAAPAGPSQTYDEWLTDVHHEFALLGIESWVDWPLDRVQLFLIEKSERDADRAAEMHQVNARRGKSQFPLFMYTIPVT